MTHALADFMKPFFSHYLPTQRGLSMNTIASYRDAIKLLLCYVADHLKMSVDALDVEDLTEGEVLDFLDYVQQQRGCVGQTRNARLAAIRGLFAFIKRTAGFAGIVPPDPRYSPQTHRPSEYRLPRGSRTTGPDGCDRPQHMHRTQRLPPATHPQTARDPGSVPQRPWRVDLALWNPLRHQ